MGEVEEVREELKWSWNPQEGKCQASLWFLEKVEIPRGAVDL